MKELAKSLNSFSWAMSLFGAQQAINLLRRPAPSADHPTTTGLDAVTGAGERQLGGYLRRTFEAGDQVQRSAVDLVFGVVTLQVLNPSRAVALSSDLVRRSGAALRALLPGAERPAGSCSCDEPAT